MGNACAKSSPVEQPGGAEAAPSNGGAAAGEDGKVKTFRDRRLSVSQVHDPNSKGAARNRRLSVYGKSEEGGPALPGGTTSPMSTCGCKSVGGVEPVPGGSTAKINQDRALCVYPFNGEKAQGLFGVFDGHGRIGEQVSQFVIENLERTMLAHAGCSSDPAKALTDSFLTVDRELEKAIDAGVSGTTAVVCYLRGNHIWLANCGDSRAVVARQKPKSTSLKAIDLTVDQKPDTPQEMKRIHQMGGHVTPAGANGSPARVWHNLRGLAMARSIGDHHAATVGVIAEPEITEYDITDDDVALIIATDGVWELLSSQTVVDIVENVKSLDPNEICDQIIDQSSYMWKVEEGDYRDDITVVVLTFPWLDSYGEDAPNGAPEQQAS